MVGVRGSFFIVILNCSAYLSQPMVQKYPMKKHLDESPGAFFLAVS